MAEKRLTQDGNPVHAKKQKQEQDETSTDLISKEEKMLFSVDRFLRRNSLPLRNIKSKHISIMDDFFSRALYFIDQAYCSIRRTGNEDIVKVLKDTATMRALIRFASCLRQMREYHLCMKAIRTDLLMKLKNDGTTASVSSGRSGRGKCPRCSLIHAQASLMPNEKASLAPVQGDNPFSIKVYNMLLIINEVLTQMGIQSEDVQGYGHAELTEMVIRGMGQLRTEMWLEEALLIELIKSECKSECASACDELRRSLALNLRSQVEAHSMFLSSGNKEIYRAFRDLIEFMDDTWLRWHTFKFRHHKRGSARV